MIEGLRALSSPCVVRRERAPSSGETFSIPPISRMLDRWLKDVAIVVDPFARNSKRGTHRNDLNPDTSPEYHWTARDYLDMLHKMHFKAGAVLFDPPYSQRQAKELYEGIGLAFTARDAQVISRWTEERDLAADLLEPGGIAISFGWDSIGFGLSRGFAEREILLVCHGGGHHDTIATVEEKVQANLPGLREPRRDKAVE